MFRTRRFSMALIVLLGVFSMPAQAQEEDLPSFTTAEPHNPSHPDPPFCRIRTRSTTPGGFIDIHSDLARGMVYTLRVPISLNDIDLQRVTWRKSPYPRRAYLEILASSTWYDQLPTDWNVALVLPPMTEPSHPIGPQFTVTKVEVAGKPVVLPKLSQMYAQQLRIELPGFESLVKNTSAPLDIKATLSMMVPESDTTQPKVVINSPLPSLRTDIQRTIDLYQETSTRRRNDQCNVRSADCRDGECR